jgi:hypothetical protein
MANVKKIYVLVNDFGQRNMQLMNVFFVTTLGFHESSNVNTLEFPYGLCNVLECGCQRFQGQILDGLRCIYCDHYEGFHSSWETPNNNDPITLLSNNNFHSNIIPSSNSTALTRFTNPRAEVIANFRPTQTIPLYSSQLHHTHTTHTTRRQRRNGHFSAPPLNHSTGRPPADRLTINYIICFEKSSPDRLPKEGSTFWSHLKSKNLIKENIEISRTTSDQLYNMIYDLFDEELNNQRWILYNGSSGSPRKITNNVSVHLFLFFY